MNGKSVNGTRDRRKLISRERFYAINRAISSTASFRFLFIGCLKNQSYVRIMVGGCGRSKWNSESSGEKAALGTKNLTAQDNLLGIMGHSSVT